MSLSPPVWADSTANVRGPAISGATHWEGNDSGLTPPPDMGWSRHRLEHLIAEFGPDA